MAVTEWGSGPVKFKGKLLLPGDLLMTHSGTGFFGKAIRLSEAMEDEPNLVNHIALYSHADKNGTPWCLEGRPGGFGWQDATSYLKSRWTVTNILQPKTDTARGLVVTGMQAMIGTAYDWEAIGADGLKSIGINIDLAWQPDSYEYGTAGTVPGHVVCSSSAAYLYSKAGLPHPAGDRLVTPADWLKFAILHGWNW